ncbi:TetR/AcrR family transcriptional regulator [Xylocopilactobacillus apis]|uniref:HTH tetR-type domain-containing protein n=1 Tax=Xylocopilactobacillus apis TaxID=2932183 RepID=A0AAU9DJG8_9LACO|nr:TetR/AcrR family transcriptional regulator [Xylocopilactobacillus apis]BDR55564.1 hypothetical protein KIMC2_01260 [Xylocopilactobacillus apis]
MDNQLVTNIDYWYKTDKMPASQRKVLASAIKLFSTQGYDKTSTSSISQDAHVSQAIIFKYFHSKEELLKSILKPIINNVVPVYAEQFLDHLKSIKFNQEEAEDGIYYLFRERFNFMYQNKEVIMILISQALINDDIKNDVIKALNKKQDKLMRLMWLKFKDLTGSKNKEEFKNFVELFVTQVMAYFLQVVKIAPNEKYDFEKDLRRFARNVYLTI